VRFAYADPPYVGCGHRYPEQTDVDHAALIARLVNDYPDGWALSCHSPSLHALLPQCPAETRVLAWVKPFAVFKANVGLAYAWEPVLLHGGRRRSRQQPTTRDWHAESITLRTGLVGAKPPSFCRWLLEALNFAAGDELVDLFPGTGVMTRAAQSHGRLATVTGPLFDAAG
jgi:hypothetical protein